MVISAFADSPRYCTNTPRLRISIQLRIDSLRTDLFRSAPPADKSRQRLHRRLCRIQIDPLVRIVCVTAARAEQQRGRVEMVMENEHIAGTADASHQRWCARDLPESFR